MDPIAKTMVVIILQHVSIKPMCRTPEIYTMLHVYYILVNLEEK